jgi:hypothetical protein
LPSVVLLFSNLGFDKAKCKKIISLGNKRLEATVLIRLKRYFLEVLSELLNYQSIQPG